MTTAQIDEIWHAHSATTDAVELIVSALTLEDKAAAFRAYRDAERRFYAAWYAVASEMDAVPVDPVAESLDRESVEVGHG